MEKQRDVFASRRDLWARTARDPASQGRDGKKVAKKDAECTKREKSLVHPTILSAAHSMSRLFRKSEVSFIRAVKNLALVRRALTEIRLE